MLTDEQIEALPTTHFPPTPGRIAYRRAWGYDAGEAAFARGTERNDNAFSRLAHMPMHESWLEGWDEAVRSQEAKA